MIRVAAAGLAILLLTACKEQSSTGKLEQTEMQPGAAALASGEQVVILNDTGWDSEDEGPAGCVKNAVRRTNSKIHLQDGDAFRTGLYPWFEPGVAPKTEEELSKLLRQPLVSRKVAALGVRYVVMMSGGTHTSNAWGEMFPGPPGAVVGSDVRISFHASVWDMKKVRSAGSLGTSVSGSNFMLLIPPIPIMNATEQDACDDIGRRLAEFFTGG